MFSFVLFSFFNLGRLSSKAGVRGLDSAKLLPEPLWRVGSQQGVSCHHATLLDVQASFPSPTLLPFPPPAVRGMEGEENGCLLLLAYSVPGSSVCVFSHLSPMGKVSGSIASPCPHFTNEETEAHKSLITAAKE